MKVFIIHGAYGDPEENWIPWLRKELEKKGHTVFVPQLPHPPHQNLDSWLKAFEYYIHLIDDDSILIGHSIAPAFILNILEGIHLTKPVRTCIFVSGFLEPLHNKFDPINKTFIEKKFDWKTINQNCERFIVFHGTNDPYVSLDTAHRFAALLHTTAIEINNGGHLNTAVGYTTFPALLQEIEKLK